jgi:hypothetical protein
LGSWEARKLKAIEAERKRLEGREAGTLKARKLIADSSQLIVKD